MAKRKKRALPDWYLAEPEMLPGDKFWMDAFSELNTCRNSWFLIPYPDIIGYAERLGLAEDFVDGMVIIIRTMDITYREWYEEQREAQAKKDSKGKSDAPERNHQSDP